MLQNVSDFRQAFVFKSLEGVYFGGCSDVLMVVIMVFYAFRAEGFDAGHGRAEVGERFSVVFEAGVFDVFGGELGSIEVRVITALHLIFILKITNIWLIKDNLNNFI